MDRDKVNELPESQVYVITRINTFDHLARDQHSKNDRGLPHPCTRLPLVYENKIDNKKSTTSRKRGHCDISFIVIH